MAIFIEHITTLSRVRGRKSSCIDCVDFPQEIFGLLFVLRQALTEFPGFGSANVVVLLYEKCVVDTSLRHDLPIGIVVEGCLLEKSIGPILVCDLFAYFYDLEDPKEVAHLNVQQLRK